MMESEWSYIFKVEEVSSKTQNLSIMPDDAARARLVRRLGLLSLDACEARFRIARENGHIIHIRGIIEAQIRQACVATLEPVMANIQESFQAWYAEPDQVISLKKIKYEREAKASRGEMPMLEEHDDPEPVIDGKIDLGELATQYLSLAIDPYPHAPGVDRAQEDQEKVVYQEQSVIKNPFAALKEWKDKLK